MGEHYGFFRDNQGNRSMGRLLAFMTTLVGAGTIAGGLAAFLKVPSAEALAIITVGAGLCGGSEWAKNKAKVIENGSGSQG